MVSASKQLQHPDRSYTTRVWDGLSTDSTPEEFSPASLSPNGGLSPLISSPDLSIRIPKNKSTGNLLAPIQSASADMGRTRFSFDAGSAQEMKNLSR